jgi:hypothetical protein
MPERQDSQEPTTQQGSGTISKSSLVLFIITGALLAFLAMSEFVTNFADNQSTLILYLVALFVAAIGTLLGLLVAREIVLTRVQALFIGQVVALIVLVPCVVFLAINMVETTGQHAVSARKIEPTAKASDVADSHQDCAGNWYHYEPEKAVDHKDKTAWRVRENGKDQWIELHYTKPVRVHEVIVIPGHDKIDPTCGIDRFKQLHVVHRASIEFRDETGDVSVKEAKFERDRSRQLVTLDSPKVAKSVRFTIEDTYAPGTKEPIDEIAVSEIELK